MRSYEAQATIERGPDAVWAVLTDAPGYADWDSGVERVEGTIAPGETDQGPLGGEPRPRVPGEGHRVPAGARHDVVGRACRSACSRGCARSRLEPADGGATRFRMREEYTGPLLPLIWRTMPDLGPSFEQFARGLKARVETAPMP